MHKNKQSGESVSAPDPVQRAKNLVEEFFGLSLKDTEFAPPETFANVAIEPADHYYTELLSPTGRELGMLDFMVIRQTGWVKLLCRGNQWTKALQTAIDTFVNHPKGGFGVLGDFKPTVENLNAVRLESEDVLPT